MIKPGRVTREWLKTRKAWLKANPPNFQGYYVCHYCHTSVPAAEITLDHIIPRSRAPHLRFEPSNLVPACAKCNSAKGSRMV